MTSPRLAQDSPFGRLYQHPSTVGSALPPVGEALASGLLMPSVTNVIGVMDKPFLTTWYSKMTAEAAVGVVRDHPGLIESKPDEAVDWLKNSAARSVERSAALGDLVHNTVEALALGREPEIDPSAAPYLASFRRFVADYDPTFLHVEATCFGAVQDQALGALPYAGTADFIARIGGRVVVGDWKTGKSIHTEAALQACALANADEILLAGDEPAPMPHVDAGIVVHLTPRGYKVRKAQIDGASWELFCTMRRMWDFHVANIASRGPLLMSAPLAGPEALTLSEWAAAPLSSGILRPRAAQ